MCLRYGSEAEQAVGSKPAKAAPSIASASVPGSRILPCLVPALTAPDDDLLYGSVSEINHFLPQVAFGHGVSSQ